MLLELGRDLGNSGEVCGREACFVQFGWDRLCKYHRVAFPGCEQPPSQKLNPNPAERYPGPLAPQRGGHVGCQTEPSPLPTQLACQPALPLPASPRTGASALRLGGSFSAWGGAGGWERPQLAYSHKVFWSCLSKPLLMWMLGVWG